MRCSGKFWCLALVLSLGEVTLSYADDIEIPEGLGKPEHSALLPLPVGRDSEASVKAGTDRPSTTIAQAQPSSTRGGQREPETGAAPPQTPPEAVVPDVLGPEGGWPPQAAGATNIQLVPSREIVGAIADRPREQFLQTALGNVETREVLGERYAYITADTVEQPKERTVELGEQRIARLLFYSYTNNAAVEVHMRGQEVERVEVREGFQPPEGREEIELAIALARRDPRIRDQVRALTGSALLAFPQEGEPGYGDRVLDVTFSGDEPTALYHALVDLTTEEVLEAGPVAGR